MDRAALVMIVGLLVAGEVAADVPPLGPPPSKGMKYISVNNEVVLGKDVTGYVFVQQVQHIGPPFTDDLYVKLDLTADKATAIAAGARRTSVSLIAVPQDAAKEFKTDAALFDALKAKKVKGIHAIGFADATTAADTAKRDSVKRINTITAIDPKDGIKIKSKEEEAEQPGKKPETREKSPSPGVSWMAGGSAALAVLLGGFWLAGRTRRKA